MEQQALYSGCGGMHAGPWSARDLPDTPLMFRTFLWWLATPFVEVNPVVLLRTPLERLDRVDLATPTQILWPTISYRIWRINSAYWS